jgi:hypothetical protein
MRAQAYGRIVVTTSSSGLYGNFGQSNYGAAKMALVGLMNTLALEGAKHNIRVNALAPTAATAMTQGLMPPEMLARLHPSKVAPAVVYLASDEAPTKTIVCAGAGSFELSHITLTQGLHLGDGPEVADELAQRFAEVANGQGERVPASGSEQAQLELGKSFG